MKQLSMDIVKKIIFGLFLSAMTGAYAETSALKIGTVNLQEISTKAPQIEKANKRIQKEFQGKKDAFIEKQKKIQAAEEKFQRDREVLSENERKKTEKDLNKQKQDFRRENEELNADFYNRQLEEREAFSKIITEVLNQIAADEKYDLILAKEATLVSASTMDLTDKVLKKLESVPDTKLDKKEKK